MEYKKPSIVGYNAAHGIIPAVIAAAPLTVTFGLSLAQAAVGAGVAALAGAAVGAAVARKGGNFIDSSRTQILTARKTFALE